MLVTYICFGVKNIFWRKKSDIHSVRPIDHAVRNNGVETSVSEFSGILSEFSTNQNCWWWACTSCSYITNSNEIFSQNNKQKLSYIFFESLKSCNLIVLPLNFLKDKNLPLDSQLFC